MSVVVPHRMLNQSYYRMIRSVMVCLAFHAAILVSPVMGAEDGKGTEDARVQATLLKAREVTAVLQKELKSEIRSAMKVGGPMHALRHCHEKALPVTKRVSETMGAEVGRIALKRRNPANVPNAWEQQQLEGFLQRIQAGERTKGMEAYRVEGTQLRYVKAIPMGAGGCVMCHGGKVAPALYQKILALYPQDKAVGFAPGDLRGAFTVTLPLQSPEEKAP